MTFAPASYMRGAWSVANASSRRSQIRRLETPVGLLRFKDFGELAVVFGRRHCGIVRLVDLDPRKQAASCIVVLARHGEELAFGAIATVTQDRIRLRPAEDTLDESDDASRPP